MKIQRFFQKYFSITPFTIVKENHIYRYKILYLDVVIGILNILFCVYSIVNSWIHFYDELSAWDVKPTTIIQFIYFLITITPFATTVIGLLNFIFKYKNYFYILTKIKELKFLDSTKKTRKKLFIIFVLVSSCIMLYTILTSITIRTNKNNIMEIIKSIYEILLQNTLVYNVFNILNVLSEYYKTLLEILERCVKLLHLRTEEHEMKNVLLIIKKRLRTVMKVYSSLNKIVKKYEEFFLVICIQRMLVCLIETCTNMTLLSSLLKENDIPDYKQILILIFWTFEDILEFFVILAFHFELQEKVCMFS